MLKKTFSYIFFLLSINHSLYARDCISVNKNQFDSVLISHVKPVKLVFFSTWCADCKIEIKKIQKEQNQSGYILIAEFDSLERVNKALNKMNILTECYFDSDKKIKEEYGVKFVPAEVEIK